MDYSERLALIGPLKNGSHEPPRTPNNIDACVMEAVAFVAGEPWSDTPECACPVIGAFLRSWNDALRDDERDRLIRPLTIRLIGTRSTPEIERRRATMAADWLIREHTPEWLRLAGLTSQADALAALPEITDFLHCPSMMPALKAARRDADAARDAARGAAWAAAWAAARDAARGAAWAAARGAAWDEAGAAARDAALDEAGAAAWAAAWAAARDVLTTARASLQQSALRLIDRMIEVR